MNKTKFFVVWRPGLPPPHLEGIDIDGYLVSIINYYKKKNQPYLPDVLDYDGTIIVDSGAFSFGKKNSYPAAEDIVEIQANLGAKIAVPLDYPLLYAKNEHELIKFKLNTIENNDKWLNYEDTYGFKSIGVFQGDLNDIKVLFPKIRQNYVGLGGRAYSPTNGMIYSRSLLISELKLIKNFFKDKYIHLFGYSGIDSYNTVSQYIDSFDTLSPQLYAGYRTILTENSQSRNPKWVKYQSNSILDVDKCPCKICVTHKNMILRNYSISENYRYLHNVYWLSNFYKNVENKSTSKSLYDVLNIDLKVKELSNEKINEYLAKNTHLNLNKVIKHATIKSLIDNNPILNEGIYSTENQNENENEIEQIISEIQKES